MQKVLVKVSSIQCVYLCPVKQEKLIFLGAEVCEIKEEEFKV